MLHQTTQEIIADEIGREIYKQDQENAKTLSKIATNLATYAKSLKEEAKKIALNGNCNEALRLLNCLEEYAPSIRELKTSIEKANSWHDCRNFVKKLEV